jgi:hypothetical protein
LVAQGQEGQEGAESVEDEIEGEKAGGNDVEEWVRRRVKGTLRKEGNMDV